MVLQRGKLVVATRLVQTKRGQQGLVLFVALILMVAMSLAGLAMMRTVGAGVAIAGNLAFKTTATSVADLGVEAARNWLTTSAADVLKSDSPANGYISNWGTDFSPLTFDWSTAKLVTASDGAGNEVRYVIHRLCKFADLYPNDGYQQCATLSVAGGTSSKGGSSYGSTILTTTIQPYFRVTSRVLGPRNTISYVQVVMY